MKATFRKHFLSLCRSETVWSIDSWDFSGGESTCEIFELVLIPFLPSSILLSLTTSSISLLLLSRRFRNRRLRFGCVERIGNHLFYPTARVERKQREERKKDYKEKKRPKDAFSVVERLNTWWAFHDFLQWAFSWLSSFFNEQASWVRGVIDEYRYKVP